MSNFETICTFTLENLYMGIRASDVHEVLLAQALTRVPLAHPVIAGLINMRGQIVLAVDLRRVMRLPPLAIDARPPINIIVRSNSGLVCLIVDQVGDVLEIESRLFTAPPDNTPADTKDLFCGAFQFLHQLLLIFDTNRAIDAIVAQAKTKISRTQT